jgi:dolichol-phosphate mannosyltransferase
MDGKKKHDGLLSVILFSYFSSTRLERTSQKIIAKMEEEKIPFELIIIDDGSTDDSFDIARGLARNDKRIRAYQLSRNYTTNYAKFAGLEVCKGQCAVTVPDDLQRPLSTVVEMYRLWQQGEQIVIDYRVSRDDGWLNDLFSSLYYRIMNWFSQIKFPPGGADGFLADREVIDILVERIHPINTSIMVEILRLGFSPYYLPSERPKVNSKSRWTFKKKLRLALDTFFTSSNFPIRLITFVGLITFIISLFLIILVIYAKFYADNRLFGFSIPGWTTTIIFITLFNSLNVLSIGIIAEYIWRIYEEAKGRPGYIIKKNHEEHE